MGLEPTKSKKRIQHKLQKKLILFFLIGLAVAGSFCFHGKDSAQAVILPDLFYGKAVLCVQNCENSNSAYRGNQIQLIQNILRTIRFNHNIAVAKDADLSSRNISELLFIPILPAKDTPSLIQDFSLKICLKSSLPVRAGPRV